MLAKRHEPSDDATSSSMDGGEAEPLAAPDLDLAAILLASALDGDEDGGGDRADRLAKLRLVLELRAVPQADPGDLP